MILTALLLMVVFSTTFAQNPINISGIVKDSETKNPIAGVNVTLTGPDLSVVTGSDGLFSIKGTSIQINRQFESKNRFPVRGTNALYFNQEKDGLIKIRILDLSGRQLTQVFSGTLDKGFWMVRLPELSFGLYLCTFETPHSLNVIRFLSTGSSVSSKSANILTRLDKSGPKPNSLSKRALLSSVMDTIIAEKDGYRTFKMPIDLYLQTDLEILLEDTSNTDFDNVTIIPDPSWTCFMPDGIPPPKLGEKVFTIVLNYGAVHDIGITRFGQRYQYDIDGGSISGSGIDGMVLTGGLDYELILSNGSRELEQIVILRAGSSHILMRNAGIAPDGAKNVRVVLDFEAPNSSQYNWLHDSKFAANRVVDSSRQTITLEVYDITNVSLTDNRIEINDPQDVENQTWECVVVSGRQGSEVFTENVLLGSSISIGASKRGNRNIIPITGGNTTGRVEGRILPGGADYQLGGLDARYTVESNDGEFIIIRNCGSGQLIPVFETRVDGPYDFLNENKYISSPPGIGGGGVSITFYEIN